MPNDSSSVCDNMPFYKPVADRTIIVCAFDRRHFEDPFAASQTSASDIVGA